MQDQTFTIYKEEYVTLNGSISGGCLELESHVYGDDDFSSEKRYSFSKTESDKLFQILSLEEFVELCRKERLMGMEAFLEEHGITYKSYTW